MIKNVGGSLSPASDIEADKMTRFESSGLYEVDIKVDVNAAFHRKMFAFLNFCFKHWVTCNDYPCHSRQFDVFRDHMTVLAGFYDVYYALDGKTRIEPKSLSYASMEQPAREQLYNAYINIALRKIFQNTDDITYNTLVEFFR